MDAGVFNKWEKLDSILQCSSVVAYLENEHFGYIVKEQLENGKHLYYDNILIYIVNIIFARNGCGCE